MVRKFTLDARAKARAERTYLGTPPPPLLRKLSSYAPRERERLVLQHYSGDIRPTIDPKFVGTGELHGKRGGMQEAEAFGVPVSFFYRASARPERVIEAGFPARHVVSGEFALYPINDRARRPLFDLNRSDRAAGIDIAAAGWDGISFRRPGGASGKHNEVVLLFDETVPERLPPVQSAIFDPRWF